MLTVKTHTFRAGAVLPVFKTAGAAGADIRAFLKDIEKDHPIWNYIQIDAEGYRKQEVTLGESDDERVEILTGVKKGDRVVTKGAVQVRLASAANAIPAHNHNH